MKSIFKRNINLPTGDTEKVETMDMWVVSWHSRHGEYSGDIKKRYQSFFNEDDARKLKKALDDANKLIGNTSKIEVNIEKQKNCL
jgi:hypothetical protein